MKTHQTERSSTTRELLRRTPVAPDPARMRAFLGGKRVLVTGAAGSIGSELCRRICEANATSLILVDRAESPLCEIDRDLAEAFPDMRRCARLADVCSPPAMHAIFERHRPQIVFHSAAFKQVPLLEAHPCEVILNNTVASAALAQAARAHECEAFVLISSDKAVNPVSVMGASKRVAEMYLQHLSRGADRGRTAFLTVRFGNVLGSAGSVLPLLRRQIEKGGPVTVTHPQMSRYFMTVEEAVQLVVDAAAMASGGEIFVLEMGDAVSVLDLAQELIRRSDRAGDISITFTGVRPGEKLAEELWSQTERVQSTANPHIKAIFANGTASGADLTAEVDTLRTLAQEGQVARLVERLKFLVPELTLRANGVAARRGRARVLVVDDDADLREVLRHALEGAGHDVVTAGDGTEAIEKIGAAPPDLAVIDLLMPKLDGLALFRRLKAEPSTSRVPVLLVTGHAEVGAAVRDLPFVAEDVLSKPFRLSDLVARVHAILQRAPG